MTVTAPVPGQPSTECWNPTATFLATLAPLEAWPETDDGVGANPQTIEMAMHGLPWKVALESSRKLAGRLGWL